MGRLIVGLGNPGSKYKGTRHNVGFMALDELQKALELDDFKTEQKFEAEITKGNNIILAKPLTFMNLSGIAVQKIASFYKIDSKDITIIFDDVDLPLGEIRIREKGSAGTHNGMKSIIETFGTEAFPRIRIGIESRGVTAPEQQDISSFVLENFTDKELKIIKESISKIPEIVQNPQ